MSFSRLILIAVCAGVFLTTSTALATDVTIICGPGPVLQGVIDSLAATNPNGPNKITLSGTCQEAIVIKSMKNLTIQANTPGTDGLKPPAPGPVAIVNVKDSYNIILWGLVLDGADSHAGGVFVDGSQSVQVQSLTIKNGDMGVTCNHSSYCIVNPSAGATTISNMNRQGISVGGNSSMELGGSTAGTNVEIKNSGGGILVGGGSTLYMAGTWLIQDTSGGWEGIAVIGSTLGYRGGPGGGTIKGTTIGIHVTDNGSFTYGNPLTIENNKQAVLVRNSSVAHLGGNPGNLLIRNNTDPSEPRRYGGVTVNDGSILSLSNATITGNQLAGISSRNNGTITLVSSSITGNLGDGVLVTQRSAVWLFERALTSNTISGNTGKDLVCTVQGTAFGDNSGVGKMQCPTFDKIQ